MPKRGPKKVAADQEDTRLRPVRLDLSDSEHERLSRVARKKGLSKAAFARMAVLERLDAEDHAS